MPITSSFDSNNFHNSIRTILREHLLDFFPSSSYVIVEEPPTIEDMKKPLVWFSPVGGNNLDRWRTRRSGITLQRKEISFGINLFTNAKTPGTSGPANLIRQMATTLERDAILRDGYKLATAGLFNARITPFTDVVEPSESKFFRKYAVMSLTVYVQAS